MPVVLVGRKEVSKWLPEAPWCRKKDCLHAIKMPFCRLCGQDTVLAINSVHEFHVCLSSTCTVKVLRLMNGCLSLLESQTVGPVFMVPVRMMEHLTVELLRVPVSKIPQGLQHFISLENCKALCLETAWCGGREKSYCKHTPFPCWGLQPLLRS